MALTMCLLDVVGPAPLTLGYDYVYRGGLDGSLAWTMVQQQGFQTDGK